MIKDTIGAVGLLFFLFVSCAGLCQENVVMLKGKVQTTSNDVADVLIVNLNTKESTITDSEGVFKIQVKLNDTLQLSAVQFISKKVLITDAVLIQRMIFVDLIENVVRLNEVTVTPYNLTGKIDLDIERLNVKPSTSAISLGLPNSEITVMSQQERLLLVADRGKFTRFMTAEEKLKEQGLLGFFTIGVIVNPEKIINRLSGRTKMLKEMVSSDKDLKLEHQITSVFSKATISKELEIPKENVDGFLSFCMAQNDFPKESDGTNALEIWEYLTTKSKEYKKSDEIEEIVKTH